MSWFVRAVELGGGRWSCRFGRTEIDTHDDVCAAVAHIRALAAEHQPAELMVHHLDGTVQRLDPPPSSCRG